MTVEYFERSKNWVYRIETKTAVERIESKKQPILKVTVRERGGFSVWA